MSKEAKSAATLDWNVSENEAKSAAQLDGYVPEFVGEDPEWGKDGSWFDQNHVRMTPNAGSASSEWLMKHNCDLHTHEYRLSRPITKAELADLVAP